MDPILIKEENSRDGSLIKYSVLFLRARETTHHCQETLNIINF